jgi:hypothetical protein
MPSYEEVSQRAGSLRAMTGLTQPEFLALLPHFEQAFLAYMEHHTIDGQPRASRRYSTYDNTPLPTMADKLLFILTYLKQNPIQEVQGQLFGMSQSNANKWLHRLHTVLNQALARQDLLPARNADDLAVMLAAKRPEGVPWSPLFGMMVRSDRSTAQPIPRTNRNTTAARRSATRSKTSS